MSVSGPAPSAGCQLPDKVALPAATARVGSGSGWVLGGTLALRLPALVGSYTPAVPSGAPTGGCTASASTGSSWTVYRVAESGPMPAGYL
jgi:hypothetical protein